MQKERSAMEDQVFNTFEFEFFYRMGVIYECWAAIEY